ncbi:hypothetical protein BFC17_16755 [Alteromonas lipolytica]|uniref:Uncharacterized protein n=1 Tax=Alteromonas lipolytica TaxID=1856405 RepID=A0A1E8FGY2_9ALTE|nr:hypothetical protein BFC17_16755 [Alteromonas lipolytica]
MFKMTSLNAIENNVTQGFLPWDKSKSSHLGIQYSLIKKLFKGINLSMTYQKQQFNYPEFLQTYTIPH